MCVCVCVYLSSVVESAHAYMHTHRYTQVCTYTYRDRHTHTCRMNDKIPETDIEDQPKNQKSKAVKALEKSYLYQGWVIPD